jgi:hypothetical protein
MSKRAWPFAILALGLALPATEARAQDDVRHPAERYHLRLQYRHYMPDLTGDTHKGTDDSGFVDFNEDLAFAQETTFDARGYIQFSAGKKLRLSYTHLDYAGDTIAPKTFTYGGTRYEIGTQVQSSVKGGYYAADIQWDFVKKPQGFLGLVVGAKAIDVDTLVFDVSDNVREVDTYRIGVPVVGVAGRWYTGKFSLEGEFSGITAGNRGHIYDADTTARFHVSDRLALQGGYRWLRLEAKDDDQEVNFKLVGWQFGVELSL